MAQKIKKMKPRSQKEDNAGSVKLAWAVGGVGLCILLIAGILIATGSNGRKSERITAQESTATSSPSTQATTPAASKVTIEEVQVPPISIYRRRNPFEPLVNMDAAGSAPVPTGTGVGVDTRVVRVPEQLRGGANPPEEILSRAVTLDGISKVDGAKVAKIRVGDQVFDNVSAGQTFGEYYKVLSIEDDSSATILYGDERFSVFTGQSIYL